MEDILSACPADATRLAAEQVDGCLAHIDLMRRAQGEAIAGADTFVEVERELKALRRRLPGKRLAGLLVEIAKVNTLLYLNALRSLPMEFTVVDSGYVALGQVLQQKFDLLISGQSLPVLNGTALIAAVRLSGTDNSHIPAILVSAALPDPLPAALAPDQVLTRDTDMGGRPAAQRPRTPARPRAGESLMAILTIQPEPGFIHAQASQSCQRN